MDTLRNRYLFPLAHVCHISPAEIDDIAFIDFLILASSAEKWMELEAKRPRL